MMAPARRTEFTSPELKWLEVMLAEQHAAWKRFFAATVRTADEWEFRAGLWDALCAFDEKHRDGGP